MFCLFVLFVRSVFSFVGVCVCCLFFFSCCLFVCVFVRLFVCVCLIVWFADCFRLLVWLFFVWLVVGLVVCLC